MPAKLFATVHDHEFTLVRTANGSWATEDGHQASIVASGGPVFSVIIEGRSYQAVVLGNANNAIRLRIGANTFTVQLQDEDTRRIQELGLDMTMEVVVKEIHAPMPGLVINILVANGQAIKKGEGVLVLEAMKMENMIKAPSDGTIKRITANMGEAVEKGELLIELE